eukprot:CAMPEP_0176492392 /NCGR_PEP_ID=MMETSP0200_2-20121128/8968_1 /TAXON_ID=947934 /ORGANISM="Chaetoceros sp., Strain GSL56" /LENGTH=859 /DNA_ID=CAMNT_0017889939 /DNA_START=2707 /DNA_END=5286 /DNA_ORIENTATION=+
MMNATSTGFTQCMKYNKRYTSRRSIQDLLLLPLLVSLMILQYLTCVNAFGNYHGLPFLSQQQRTIFLRRTNNFLVQHACTEKGRTATTGTTPLPGDRTNTKAVLYKPAACNEQEVIGGSGNSDAMPPSVTASIATSTATATTTAITTATERKFPFSMIVGQEELKEAAIIAASNPLVSGMLIGGRHGTGKSVMARAIHQLLPKEIQRIKGSSYNVSPNGDGGVDSILFQDLTNKGMNLNQLETESIQTPFVQVPLNVMEDSLCGSVDIEKSMASGETVFAPGLLAKAHRGILYIDDIHLLDADILSILFDVLSNGWVTVEREGISVRYPCVPIVIATWNPDEGEITKHFTDRIGLSLSADTEQLSIQQRVDVVDNVINFSGGVEERDRVQYLNKENDALDRDNVLRNKIASARERLPSVQMTSDQILYICEEATRAGCDGQRGEIFATHIAKTCAAIDGRRHVNAKDLQTAVRLALAPRSRYFMGDVEETVESGSETVDEQTEKSTHTMPPPGLETEETREEETQQQEEGEISQQEGDVESQTDDEEVTMSIPQEFMFGVNMIPIDPKLLMFMERTKKGRGGKRSKMYNLERGRFCKAIFPKVGHSGRIAVGATLRAAAPYQRMRRKLADGTIREGRRVYIDKSDFRIKRMTKKSGALVIFVVDASGSMALNRMDAAKGAAIALLSEAYKARDKICLISFHQDCANVVVPPTKSMALTKSRLESMPCGGGSPLAHALLVASKVAMNEKKVKKDVGKVVIVMLTDGRCNVPLSISNGEGFDATLFPSIGGRPTKEFLEEEVLSCAKTYRKLDLDMLVIDTEDKFVATGIGKKIADVALGRYCQIDPRDIETIKSVTQEAI